jgi:hypothetical protein
MANDLMLPARWTGRETLSHRLIQKSRVGSDFAFISSIYIVDYTPEFTIHRN